MLEASKRSLLAVRGIQGDVQSLLEDVGAAVAIAALEEGDEACVNSQRRSLLSFPSCSTGNERGARAGV